MRKESLKTLRHLTRWIILCGVLTGIFFSSGEGLQLMPFPDSPVGAGKSASRMRDEREKFYSFSVHSFPLSLSLKSKVQKGSDHFVCSNACASEFEIAGFLISQPAASPFERPFFYASPSFLIPSGRAPPAI